MALTTLDIKEPGLNVLPPGVERYIVEGGGLTGIQILPDDEIEIINNFTSISESLASWPHIVFHLNPIKIIHD